MGDIPLPTIKVPDVPPVVSANRFQITYSLQNGVDAVVAILYYVPLNQKFMMTGFFFDCGITAGGNTIVIYDWLSPVGVEKIQFSNRTTHTQYIEMGTNQIEFRNSVAFNVNTTYVGSVSVVFFGFLQPL